MRCPIIVCEGRFSFLKCDCECRAVPKDWSTSGRVRHGSRESGSSLVFALLVLLVGSLIVTSLAGLVTNDLGNTVHFRAVRNLTYYGNAAVDAAIIQTRYWNPASDPGWVVSSNWQGWCPSSGVVDFTNQSNSVGSSQGVTVATWCTLEMPTPRFSRLMTIDAYQVPVKTTLGDLPSGGPSSFPASFNAEKIVAAKIGYVDSPILPTPETYCDPTVCALSTAIISWKVF